MREIKFRAWAKYSEKMFSPNGDNGWFVENGELSAIPNTILMQFTGLKDKNEKEIYEGDIILSTKHHKSELIFKEIGTIVYEKGRFIARTNEKGWLLIGESGYEVEVIGNIYQDASLLKK